MFDDIENQQNPNELKRSKNVEMMKTGKKEFS